VGARHWGKIAIAEVFQFHIAFLTLVRTYFGPHRSPNSQIAITAPKEAPLNRFIFTLYFYGRLRDTEVGTFVEKSVNEKCNNRNLKLIEIKWFVYWVRWWIKNAHDYRSKLFFLLPICICFYFFGGKRKRFESHAQAVSIMRDLGCRDLRDPRISHADNCEEIKFRIALIFNCRDLILFGFRWQMAIWRGFEDLFGKTWSDNDLSR